MNVLTVLGDQSALETQMGSALAAVAKAKADYAAFVLLDAPEMTLQVANGQIQALRLNVAALDSLSKTSGLPVELLQAAEVAWEAGSRLAVQAYLAAQTPGK